MGALISLVAVAGLALLAAVGASAGDGLRFVLGVIVPGVAFAVFLGGIIFRVMHWARSPVPFRVPTTTGQAKSLPWIRNNEFEAPSGLFGVIGRMALEVLAFRSLFRNTRVEMLPEKQKLNYIADKALWAAALAFHWAMFIVVLRHFRFFIEPVPAWVEVLQSVDGFFQVGLPVYYGTTFLMVAGLAYLLARRFFDAKVRYISLPTDYFALYLLARDRRDRHPHASRREGRCRASQSGDCRVGVVPAGGAGRRRSVVLPAYRDGQRAAGVFPILEAPACAGCVS